MQVEPDFRVDFCSHTNQIQDSPAAEPHPIRQNAELIPPNRRRSGSNARDPHD